MNYLIGYFSRRQVFHIVAYRDNMEEVEAFLKTHPSKLVVFGKISRPTTGAVDLLDAPACCASFVFDGTHHKDCRFAQPANH